MPGWPRGGNMPGAGPGPRNPKGGGLIPGGGGRGPRGPNGIGPGIRMNGGRPRIRGKNLGGLKPPLKSPRPL